jgi:hypothetical protein
LEDGARLQALQPDRKRSIRFAAAVKSIKWGNKYKKVKKFLDPGGG